MSDISDLNLYRADLAAQQADEDLRERLRTVCDLVVQAIDNGLETDLVLKSFQISIDLYFNNP